MVRKIEQMPKNLSGVV